jgi:hypothetical protein
MIMDLHEILPAKWWLYLVNYYDNSVAIVSVGGQTSSCITIEKGVKQGGPSSPKLLAIYIEKKGEEMRQLNGMAKI